MPRRAVEAEVRAGIEAYLAEARTLSAAVRPITALDIARAISKHRHTVTKYLWAGELDAALADQQRFAGSTLSVKDQRIKRLEEQVVDLRQKNEALLARWAVLEGNAQRLGFDPADLYQPLEAPPRNRAHTVQRVR